MTASDALLDSWAWWEILFATPTGEALARTYLDDPDVRVHASALAPAEIIAKLDAMGEGDWSEPVMRTFRGASQLHDVTASIARDAGLLRGELRQAETSASLADAIILATARRIGAVLVSNDGAFAGQDDVVDR